MLFVNWKFKGLSKIILLWLINRQQNGIKFTHYLNHWGFKSMRNDINTSIRQQFWSVLICSDPFNIIRRSTSRFFRSSVLICSRSSSSEVHHPSFVHSLFKVWIMSKVLICSHFDPKICSCPFWSTTEVQYHPKICKPSPTRSGQLPNPSVHPFIIPSIIPFISPFRRSVHLFIHLICSSMVSTTDPICSSELPLQKDYFFAKNLFYQFESISIHSLQRVFLDPLTNLFRASELINSIRFWIDQFDSDLR